MQRITQIRRVVDDTKKLLSGWGMPLDDPIILRDAGNLILWLRPYPIVARVATLFTGDNADFWGAVWRRELQVAEHLMRHNIPIVPPTSVVPPGPHQVAGSWMTLWDYAESVKGPPLGLDGIAMVRKLTLAMESFRETLPFWGAWIHVREAVEQLRPLAVRNPRVKNVLREVEVVEQRMKDEPLFPAHGDAHPGNLLPTHNGYRWIDFEDVSLMPRFWDLATFVANTALLEGIDHPIVVHARQLSDVSNDPETFWWVLRARVVMSLSSNLALALAGHGDRVFAFRQWDRWPQFFQEWTQNQPGSSA
ncbi:phosphotransferase [Sulfobacillus thermosulfidooxidans]|uniref:phosphotransferase n=1 Tax=Sulfobacillus thermosulfidooxidans TaxID=28034 RepID=UPI0003F53ED5|nr:phosphotransferase [Sulfobacillus thermosulfidooxidans]